MIVFLIQFGLLGFIFATFYEKQRVRNIFVAARKKEKRHTLCRERQPLRALEPTPEYMEPVDNYFQKEFCLHLSWCNYPRALELEHRKLVCV